MESMTVVIFGITSNLSQLKIIPALYDLESQNLIHSETKIIGIGRKDINISDFVKEILHTPNRHHQHPTDATVIDKLTTRFEYYKEDIKHEDDTIYKRLSGRSGNTLYYLATYPELYKSIFISLKRYGLNRGNGGWVKILVEKPIGHNYESSVALNKLLLDYFETENIFRVDHYLGKQDLQRIFKKRFDPNRIDHVQLSALEDFGVGKRGVYYDATGALVDMAQNHFMQMICSIAKEDLTVKAREIVIKSLVPNPNNVVLGQYQGYLHEENVARDSNSETYFALKTELMNGDWKGIPIYMRSGKKLNKSEVKISIIYKDAKIESHVIISTGADKKYDPYEKLILEAVNGNQRYFNSAAEVENSWKFIDNLTRVNLKVLKYNPGSSGPLEAEDLIQKDGRAWI